MIPFDFIYCRPSSLGEAANAFCQLEEKGKRPVYYAGGTETITMCRTESIQPGAVIDIKQIADCIHLSADGQNLQIGSACTLTQIKESQQFPLLGLACGRIADHTNQCRITLGGNLCGNIIYRETSLPLLLADAELTLYGAQGLRKVALQQVFQEGKMQLWPGELIVQVQVPKWALQAPHFHVKRTRNEKIDYPLVSISALWKDKDLRIAFSGICAHPFRSRRIEAVLNDRSLSCSARTDLTVTLLPEAAYEDAEGSSEYRIFVLKNTLNALLEDWENDQL